MQNPKYRVSQKSDNSTNYITLYERYHIFGPPCISHRRSLLRPRERLRSIVMSTSVCECLCVCLSARISPEPHVRSLPPFCACYLRPWLGPPPASLRYDVLSVLWMTSCFLSRMDRVAVWISLRRTKFAYIYLFNAKSNIIQFPIVKWARFWLTLSKLLAN